MRIKEFSNNVSLKTNIINHNECISGLFDTTKAQDSFESIRLSQVSFCGFFEKMSLKNEAVSQRRNAQKVFSLSKEIKEKSDKTFFESHRILSDSKVILRKSYKTFSQISELLNYAQENNVVYDLDSQNEGIVRRFKKDADRFIMDELVSGFCTRRAILEDESLLVMEYSPDNRQNTYIFDNSTKKLVQYFENSKTTSIGCNAQKSFTFANDELASYDSGLILRYDEFEKAREHYSFADNNMTDYAVDYELNYGGVKKFGEHYSYFGKDLNRYSKNYRLISGVCESCDEIYTFGGSDKLKKYELNSGKIFGGNETSDAYYLFEGANPKVICIENLVTSDGHRQYGKMFEYHTAKSAKPKSYYQDYKITDKLIKSYNRKIEL